MVLFFSKPARTSCTAALNDSLRAGVKPSGCHILMRYHAPCPLYCVSDRLRAILRGNMSVLKTAVVGQADAGWMNSVLLLAYHIDLQLMDNICHITW
jgi:hypothetical protein